MNAAIVLLVLSGPAAGGPVEGLALSVPAAGGPVEGALLAAPQESQERLRKLEEQVKRQQAEIDEIRKGGDFDLSFAEGLHLETRDGNLEIDLGARFIEHSRRTFDRPDASRTEPDTFFVREAFLELEATVAREFGLRIHGDMASSAGGPVSSLEEAWLEWKRLEEFRLLLGQFRAPNSVETMTPTLFTDCVERSVLARFVPDLEIGVMAHGLLWERRLGYQVAVTNGRAHLAGAGRTRNDDTDEKEILARVTASPFEGEDSALRHLRLGLYGSLGSADDVPMATDFDFTTTELAVVVLDSTAGVLDGRRTRLGAEFSWAAGPASLSAEVLVREDGVRDAAGAVEKDLPTRAWYALVTCILFGADKIPQERLVPVHPFDPAQGNWGAFELVLRAAGARIGEDEFAAVGNAVAGQSNQTRTWTFGFNWSPARNVRFSANFVREDYRDEIDFGGGRREDALNGLLFRFQMDL